MNLGDMGAEIIKVEQPGRGDDTRSWGPLFANDQAAYFLGINRNKQSITLNLKSPEDGHSGRVAWSGRCHYRELQTRYAGEMGFLGGLV